MLDENNPGPSRVVFRQQKSDTQEPPAPGTSTPPFVGGGFEPENEPASE